MRISGKTRLFGVVGDPVAHSLSPLIHNLWLAEAGLDAVYLPLNMKSSGASFDLGSLARAGFEGVNVTLPYKDAAILAATRRDPVAASIGAANTLVREFPDPETSEWPEIPIWKAYNTDVQGFSQALSHALGGAAPTRVVLIGAGGAARAAALVLSNLGVELAIVNRSKARAVALAGELAPRAETADLAQLTSMAETADIVVNSASLGHSGASLPALPAGKGRPFFDMTYGKAAAGTLEAAKAAGWAPHDGLRMLVGQAAAAFKLWFDITPDSAAALAACEAAVKARA